jgi:hypothetical protein
MAPASYIAVNNFERFQHYKDRSPPWIKLYNDVLDDYAFACLPDASKWLAVGIWLLASRHENRIPNDLAWIARMTHATEPVDLAPLLSAGFIRHLGADSAVIADRQQTAMPEREEEGEEETDTPPSSKPLLRLHTRDEVEEQASAIIRAANRGMIENPALGEASNPIAVGHGSRQMVLDWLADGIRADVIIGVVKDRAKGYKPEGRRKQITSMAYFDGAVRDEWDRTLAKESTDDDGRRNDGDTGGADGTPRRVAGGRDERATALARFE